MHELLDVFLKSHLVGCPAACSGGGGMGPQEEALWGWRWRMSKDLDRCWGELSEGCISEKEEAEAIA